MVIVLYRFSILLFVIPVKNPCTNLMHAQCYITENRNYYIVSVVIWNGVEIKFITSSKGGLKKTRLNPVLEALNRLLLNSYRILQSVFCVRVAAKNSWFLLLRFLKFGMQYSFCASFYFYLKFKFFRGAENYVNWWNCNRTKFIFVFGGNVCW